MVTLSAFTVGQVRGQLGFLEEEVSKARAHYGAVGHLPGSRMHLVKLGCAQKKKAASFCGGDIKECAIFWVTPHSCPGVNDERASS